VSGTLPTGAYVSSITTAGALEDGLVDCVFTARSATGQVGSASARQTVLPAQASVQAQLVPGTLRLGQALTLQAEATNAQRMDYACSGAASQSGSTSGASLSVALRPTAAGVVSCRISATTAAGRQTQASAQASVLP
jgi:hypothetical protein